MCGLLLLLIDAFLENGLVVPAVDGTLSTPSNVKGRHHCSFTRHALHQAGGQFASHPRFTFYMFNRINRQRVHAISDICVANASNAPTTVEDIKKAIEGMTIEGRALLGQLCRGVFELTGTPPYWLSTRNQLETFVDFLGCPDLFLTFSPAREYWADLQKHFGTYDQWCQATPERQLESARANMEILMMMRLRILRLLMPMPMTSRGRSELVALIRLMRTDIGAA